MIKFLFNMFSKNELKNDMDLSIAKQLLDEYFGLCKSKNIECGTQSLNEYINYLSNEVSNNRRKFNNFNNIIKIIKEIGPKYISNKMSSIVEIQRMDIDNEIEYDSKFVRNLENVDNLMILSNNCSGKKKYIPLSIKRQVFSNCKDGDNTCTCYCNKKLKPPKSIIKDFPIKKKYEKLQVGCFGHVVAERVGGQVHVDNLIIICRSCNSKMNIKDLRKYYKI